MKLENESREIEVLLKWRSLNELMPEKLLDADRFVARFGYELKDRTK